jgi:hypothetical protein
VILIVGPGLVTTGNQNKNTKVGRWRPDKNSIFGSIKAFSNNPGSSDAPPPNGVQILKLGFGDLMVSTLEFMDELLTY